MVPPQNTDSHLAPNRVDPVACLGGPVAWSDIELVGHYVILWTSYFGTEIMERSLD